MMGCIELVTSLKSSVTNFRNFIDLYHNYWYAKGLAIAKKVDVEEAKVKTVGRQTTRSNHPYTISEYYKRMITIP